MQTTSSYIYIYISGIILNPFSAEVKCLLKFDDIAIELLHISPSQCTGSSVHCVGPLWIWRQLHTTELKEVGCCCDNPVACHRCFQAAVLHAASTSLPPPQHSHTHFTETQREGERVRETERHFPLPRHSHFLHVAAPVNDSCQSSFNEGEAASANNRPIRRSWQQFPWSGDQTLPLYSGDQLKINLWQAQGSSCRPRDFLRCSFSPLCVHFLVFWDLTHCYVIVRTLATRKIYPRHFSQGPKQHPVIRKFTEENSMSASITTHTHTHSPCHYLPLVLLLPWKQLFFPTEGNKLKLVEESSFWCHVHTLHPCMGILAVPFRSVGGCDSDGPPMATADVETQ